MEEIIFQSSIKTVGVKNADGETICVLKIDSADNTVVERFANMINRLEETEKEAKEETKRLADEYKDRKDIDAVIASCRVDIKYLNKICEEINNMFGANTIRDMFKENYDLNPDFVPDEILLLDFLEGIMPIIENIYKTRLETKRKRFNVNRTGGKRE